MRQPMSSAFRPEASRARRPARAAMGAISVPGSHIRRSSTPVSATRVFGGIPRRTSVGSSSSTMASVETTFGGSS